MASPGNVEDSTNHIFISYQWNDQPMVLKIRDRLIREGYRVWLDVDHMEGGLLEDMAKGVEGAALLLICVSKMYKSSSNCRTEAEYAYRLRKPFIPLMMQTSYRPDGWLGMLLGARLYFTFGSNEEFKRSIPSLLDEIDGLDIPRFQDRPPSQEYETMATIMSDQLRTEDSLGYNDYLTELFQLVRDPSTPEPLTIGIYGSWGKGKSFIVDSLMTQINKANGESNEQRKSRRKWKSEDKFCCFFPDILCSVLGYIALFTILGISAVCLIPWTSTYYVQKHNKNATVYHTSQNEGTLEVNGTFGTNKKAAMDRPLHLYPLVVAVAFLLILVIVCLTLAKCSLTTLNMHYFESLLITLFYRRPEQPRVRRNDRHPEVIQVHFNAWEYAGCDYLWAGIVTTLCSCVEDQFGMWSTRLFRLVSDGTEDKKPVFETHETVPMNERVTTNAHLAKKGKDREEHTSLVSAHVDGPSDAGTSSSLSHKILSTGSVGNERDSKKDQHEDYATINSGITKFPSSKNACSSEQIPLFSKPLAEQNMASTSASKHNVTLATDTDNEENSRTRDSQHSTNNECCLKSKHSYCCIPDFVMILVSIDVLLMGIVTMVVYASMGGAVETYVIEAVAVTATIATILMHIKLLFSLGKSLYFSQEDLILQLQKNMTGPNFEEELGFMRKIKDEVRLLSKMIHYMEWLNQTQYRVVIYVDDLDRCEKHKVLKMLEAVNILLSEKGLPFLSILAIDPRVIVKCVEQSFDKVLLEANINGHEFLKKIIQLPFCIPDLNDEKVINYYRRNIKSALELVPKEKQTFALLPKNQHTLPSGTNKSEKETNSNPDLALSRKDAVDSILRKLCETPRFLEGNPRHMKRIHNILTFTMRLFLKRNSGLCTEEEIVNLGWWVILSEQWPYRLSWLVQLDEDKTQQDEIDHIRESEEGNLKDVKINLKQKSESRKYNTTESGLDTHELEYANKSKQEPLRSNFGYPSEALLIDVFLKFKDHLSYPADWRSLMSLDYDPELFVLFLQHHRFTFADLRKYMPYTVNLDRSLKHTISYARAERQMQPRDDHVAGVAQVLRHFSLYMLQNEHEAAALPQLNKSQIYSDEGTSAVS